MNLAESIQQGGGPVPAGSVAPSSLLEVRSILIILGIGIKFFLTILSLFQTGKAFTAKGMQVLEFVGKETMDLLITETGINVEKKSKNAEGEEDQLFEEVTFDRCFYIYGGPEQLEVGYLSSDLICVMYKILKCYC